MRLSSRSGEGWSKPVILPIEYTFDQNGLPTKAVMFYKNKKSYSLQVGTRNGLTTKFSVFKTSFVFL